MDFWNVETKGKIGVHPSPPLVSRTKKTTNEKKCTQEERYI